MQEALRRALLGAVREVKVNEPFNFSEGAFWPDFSEERPGYTRWIRGLSAASAIQIFYNGEFDPGSG